MKESKLISYEVLPMFFFGHGEWEQKVKLKVETKYLFGLFKRKKDIIYTITMFDSLKEHYDYWDRLIRIGGKVKI